MSPIYGPGGGLPTPHTAVMVTISEVTFCFESYQEAFEFAENFKKNGGNLSVETAIILEAAAKTEAEAKSRR